MLCPNGLLSLCVYVCTQEERQEQLSTVAELAALITGFEMIAFLQFSFDTHDTNRALQLAYAVTSAATVGVPLMHADMRAHTCARPFLRADYLRQTCKCKQICAHVCRSTRLRMYMHA